ncbi:hypothetical protein BU17DRAFT_68068 [Hysterangium stoloniferum]|nr:hypothetical protein BU17DRAFT_68068 [Hysterangium stoloniferum]
MSAESPSTEPAVPALSPPLFPRPEELVEIILCHVEDRRDLLSLALTSKLFRRIIIPSILDYNYIRCDPRRIDVWQLLASRPHYAARTRTLELINELGGSKPYYWANRGGIPYCNDVVRCKPITPVESIIPSSSPRDFDPPRKREAYEKSVVALARAIKLMTCLRRFRWSCQLPMTPAFQVLFKILGLGNDLDEFYFDFMDDWDTILPNKYNIGLPVRINPISTVYFMIRPDDCDFVVIWERAHWPFLVELTLEASINLVPEFPDDISLSAESDYYYDASEESPFATFLHNHQNIQRLRVCTDRNHPGFIQPQSVPGLRSLVLGSPFNVGPLGDWFPLDDAQQMDYLECAIAAKCLPTIQTMTSLRVLNVLSIKFSVFERLVEAAPHIQQLCIPYGSWYNPTRVEACLLADITVSCLLKLEQLVQLEGGFVVRGSDLFQTEYLINKLMGHKRLVYIDYLTREQWKLALKEAALRESFEIQLPRVTVPDIRESAGFYIQNTVPIC